MTGTLAQTIQGEASTPEGQFAVAATIANRARLGGFPGGSDPNAIVNAPQQYVGYAATPSANAQALADAIQNGTLDHFGTLGNATFFQSGPTAAANGLTGGTNIGGNWFSNAFGAPTSGFIPPSLGTGTTIADGPVIDPGTGLPAGLSDPAGAATSGAKGPGSGAQGQQVQVGLQTGFVAEIQKWLGGLWTGFTDTIGSIQNWFIRAFVIVVGLVVLAIGILKLTGTDKVVIQMAKDAAMAA